MLVDSHCHIDTIDLEPFDNQLENLLQNARDHDVSHMLCVCIDLDNFPNVLNVTQGRDNIYASVGIHPNCDADHTVSCDELVKLADNPKIVAIGETGLDYFRSEGEQDWQQQRFREHIRAAIKTQKPLIVHTRDARDDTLRILKEEHAEKVGGVLHCFTESQEMADRAMEIGFYISFSGIVTFNSAKELQAVAQNIPLERMLIETDAPYLAPVPFRGKANQPAYVKYVAEKIAQLRGIEYAEVARQTTENFFTLFKPK